MRNNSTQRAYVLLARKLGKALPPEQQDELDRQVRGAYPLQLLLHYLEQSRRRAVTDQDTEDSYRQLILRLKGSL